jgi:hypothetical protein
MKRTNAVSQFYVSDEAAAERCRESLRTQAVIETSGVNMDEKVQFFTGVVQSVDEDIKRDMPKRWKITMREPKQATPKFKSGH